MYEKQKLNVSSAHGTILTDIKGGHNINIHNCHVFLSPVPTENFIFQLIEGNSRCSSTKEIMTFQKSSICIWDSSSTSPASVQREEVEAEHLL